MTPTRRPVCAAVTLATIVIGLIWRMAPLHLPFFLWKYGGSALWAVAVFWGIAALLPKARTATVAALACLFSLAVELSRLIDSPALESFRLTLAGRLILGRIFSPRNLVAYAVAILTTAATDHALRHAFRGAHREWPAKRAA